MAPPRDVAAVKSCNDLARPAANFASLKSQAYLARCPGTLAGEIRDIAHAVLAIGSGRSRDPESILIDKEAAAERLYDLAGQLEAAS